MVAVEHIVFFFSLLLREWMGEYVIGGHAAYSSSGSSRSMMVLG